MKKFGIHLDRGDVCEDCRKKDNFITVPDKTIIKSIFFFTQCHAAMIYNPVFMSTYTLLS